MEPTTNFRLLQLMLYIVVIILGALLIIWLIRERIQSQQTNNDNLNISLDKIIGLKKKRGIYRILAVFTWTILFISLFLISGLSPKFGDVTLFLFVFFYLLTRRQGNKMILWLRRFHVKHDKPLRFHSMLSLASNGYGMPITVQDSTLKTSSTMIASQAIKRQPFLVLWIFAVAILVIYLSKPYSNAILIVGIAVMFCLLSYWYFSRKLGYLALNEKKAENSVSNLLDKINERRTSFLFGIIIIRCKDIFWKKIVKLCLKNAAVVIVDITELTENLIWELQTALQIMPPENIILSCAIEGSDKIIPVKIQKELQSLFGEETFENFHIFFYPINRVQISEWGGWKKLTFELSNSIAKGLVHTRDIKGPVLHCPNCETPYHFSDYRMDAENWICSNCNTELPRLAK